jgi:hypothetical protein
VRKQGDNKSSANCRQFLILLNGRNVRIESIVLINPLQAGISAIITVASLNIVGFMLITTSAPSVMSVLLANVGVGPGCRADVGKFPGKIW